VPTTTLRDFPAGYGVHCLGDPGWRQAILDIHPTQPATLNDLDALCATLTHLAPRVQESGRLLPRYQQRAVELSPASRSCDQAYQRETTDVLAVAIAARRGLAHTDAGCELLAAIALLVFRRSLDIWLSCPTGADLAVVIRTEFQILSNECTS
jgi:hypothetical protein